MALTRSTSVSVTSTCYKGREPKTWKVTLAAPKMVSEAIHAWHDNRQLGPPEVQLRSFLQLIQTPDKKYACLGSVYLLLFNRPNTRFKSSNEMALFVPVTHSEPNS
ncbi:unnamed protein product [Dicrocoelium dendriticum]|nr:unnamed protein product [Dicrocoelium dendriticum]